MQKNPKKEYDVVVIGGGASGMMAAGRAAELGASVCILEKNNELGKKLKITGGGRCNITNAEFDTRKFLEKFPQAKNFLYSPFSQFSTKDTFEFFESRGLPLVVEAKKRAFPETQRAYDVYKVLEKYLRKGKVDVYIQNPVVKVQTIDNKIQSVYTPHGRFFAKKFILATGGFAAPETGSTGDGFKFLSNMGHTVSNPNPNVVPLTSNTTWVQKLSGTTWSFLKLSFIQNEKAKIKKVGKILFTHFGISGPLVLNSAYEVRQLLDNGAVEASIDLFPDTDFKNLDKRLQKLLEVNSNKDIQNILPELVQKRLSETILNLLPSLDKRTKGHSITKEERKAITHLLKDLRFDISGTLGYEKAVLADGGISLEEVDFKTMQSKKYNNLYLLGDILNINRPSGGYSLQLCWTTGYIAGTHSAKKA